MLRPPICLCSAMAALAVHAAPSDWYGIQVVDRDTGRGVPLVELETVSNQVFVTDSHGWAAIREPGWEGVKVYFHVRSHGYTHRKDGFGNRGKALTIRAGGRDRLAIERVNVAERLYRLTGEGIYRDSVLLGEDVPLQKPLLNARVFGQDTVFATPYRNTIFWLWGDTDRSGYPLGNFRTTAATSIPPEAGGLSPDIGVDYTYFTADNGFTRKMCPFPDIPGPLVWLGGLIVLPDAAGHERLIARYTTLEELGKPVATGMCMFNHETGVFDQLCRRPLDTWRLPGGHPLLVTEDGTDYVLFASAGPFYTVRAPATLAAVSDPDAYETFTCIAEGHRFAGDETQLSRTPDGDPNWRWTSAAGPLDQQQEHALIKAGLISREQGRFQLHDADTGDRIRMHNGSCFWNDRLRAYVLTCGQTHGRSFLGEIWFAAAPSPTGPWGPAVRIITHDTYSFYNPTQHAFFDREGGRYVYIEGTYVTTFSKSPVKTPRYDYNQIMYRLDITDPRLHPAISTPDQ